MKRTIMITMFLLLIASGQLIAQEVGEPAPGFEVNLIEPDTTFNLSDHQGKVVFIYFFGNGCPSCKSAGPNIEGSIYQAFKENINFTAVGIDTWDTSSSPTSVTSFRNTTGISFPLAVKGGSVAASFKTTYDRLVVIDQVGNIVHKGVLLAGNDIDNAVEAINTSLSITGSDPRTDVPRVVVVPNPASDLLHISSKGTSISVVALYDIAGKQVVIKALSQNPPSSQLELSVQELDHGFYFYRIYSEEGLPFTGKVLIRR